MGDVEIAKPDQGMHVGSYRMGRRLYLFNTLK